MKQLRASQTDHNSTTNPKIYQFVAIRGIPGLCGIVALEYFNFSFNPLQTEWTRPHYILEESNFDFRCVSGYEI